MARNEIPRKHMRWVSGLLLILAGCVELPQRPQLRQRRPPRAGPGVVLSSLGTLREPRSCSDRHERQLCWSGRKWQRILSRSSARVLSHRPGELRRGISTRTETWISLSGQQLYVKIVSLDSWGMSVSGCKNCARDAFYAWLIPPEIAQTEIARDRTGI